MTSDIISTNKNDTSLTYKPFVATYLAWSTLHSSIVLFDTKIRHVHFPFPLSSCHLNYRGRTRNPTARAHLQSTLCSRNVEVASRHYHRGRTRNPTVGPTSNLQSLVYIHSIHVAVDSMCIPSSTSSNPSKGCRVISSIQWLTSGG